MKVNAGISLLLLAVFSAAGLLYVAMVFTPAADAGIVGSPHDFAPVTGPYTNSAAVAPSGSCSACHVPHLADSFGLWVRNLTLYREKLGMNGSISSEPNYVHLPTIPCYDCHDSHDDTSNRIDAVPNKNDFAAGHKPQNIAFGFTKTGTGSMTEDSPGGTVAGYYENKPPYENSPSQNYGADPNLNPSDNAQLRKTGGHYFKYTDPDESASAFKIGDKLPCRDCHDPHEWDTNWQAFMRRGTSWPTGVVRGRLSSPVAASPVMANAPVSGSRDTLNGGRQLCTACHGTSDGQGPVAFTDISTAYTSLTSIVRPKAGVSEHSNSDTSTPCVSCHPHNSVDVSCGECHGYPPPNYPSNNANTPIAYGASADSHARHVGGYSLVCDVCHAGNIHQDGNVQVAFDCAFLGGRLVLPGVSVSNPSPPKRVPPGGSQCSNIYCHSSGRDGITPSGDPAHYSAPRWGIDNGAVRCNSCHGTFADFPADNSSMRYGAPNYPSGPAGSASANSHEVHAARYECAVCHADTVTGTFQSGRTIAGPVHVNGAREVKFGGVASGTYGTLGGNPKSCSVNCHGAGRSLQWGGALSCDGCHEPKGALMTGGAGDAPHSWHVESYGIACEQCHAAQSSRPGGNTTHNVGMPPGPAYDNSPSTGRYVEVKFTDNVGTNWKYDNTAGRTLRTLYMFSDPLRNYTAVSPAYTDNAGVFGADSYSPAITWSAGTCGNVWCHSNGNPVGGTASYRVPTWSAATDRCSFCHWSRETYGAMNSRADRMSRGHLLHAASDRYYFSCEDCHDDTTQRNSSGEILTPNAYTTYHVNGRKEIRAPGEMFVFPPTKRNRQFISQYLAYDNATRKCANVYCHSDGTVRPIVPPYFDNIAVQSPEWDSGTTTCTGCHGGGKDSGNPIATLAHGAHVAKEGYKCSKCHASTVEPGSDSQISAQGYQTTHVNGSVELVAGDSEGFTTHSPSCSSITCHNNNPTVVPWNGTLPGCSACHLSGKPETDHYLTATPDIYADNVIGNIDNVQWFYSGHGKGSGTYDASGHPAADFPGGVGDGCAYCHDPNVPHRTPGNPFRLVDQTGKPGLGSAGWNATCLVCHARTASGYTPTGYTSGKPPQANDRVDAAHYGSRHADGTYGGKFCWDCHDPHGDRSNGSTGNIYMIHSVATKRSDGVTGARGASGQLTVPVTFRNDNTVTASGDWARSDFAGICQVCHTGDGTGTQGAKFYTSTRFMDHNKDQSCINCHRHDSGFAPTGCEGCHGYPPLGAAPNIMTTPDNSFSYWTQSGHGKWAGNLSIPLQYRPTCEACHDIGVPANTHADGTRNSAEGNFNANTFHLRATVNGVPTLPSSSSPDGTQSTFDNFCWNACHQKKPTGSTVKDMRHSFSFHDNLVRFGRTGNTYPDPSARTYPASTSAGAPNYGKPAGGHIYTDSALTTNAPTTGSWYAPCVSCHDPHGTAAADTSDATGTNVMVRGNWRIGKNFCMVCHQ